jgi:transcriptional regulator with XRE-family HTH domain
MDMAEFGKRMRARRKQRGLTQMELARRTGIIQGDISLLERGKKHALWADTLERIAATLGCSLDYLVGRTADPAPLPPTPPRKRPRSRTTAPVG